MRCWQCNSEIGSGQVICDTCGALLMKGAKNKVSVATPNQVTTESPVPQPEAFNITKQPRAVGSFTMENIEEPEPEDFDDSNTENKAAEEAPQANWGQIILLGILASFVLSIPLCLMMAWRSNWPKNHKIVFTSLCIGYGLLNLAIVVIGLLVLFGVMQV